MSFRDRVYDVTSTIPKGKVATYGQIARLAGNPKAARAVGIYMRKNPYTPRVPCHRVIGAAGDLIGFSAGSGIATKKAMLQKEGVIFKKNIIDLSISQWLV